MTPFHFNSWLIYFYFYCIVGWIFESGNVSIRQKKWVNRGFMTGPWLPLYGSGAVIILIATLPFATHPVAVYVVGALAATVLEYFTGVAMLAIFKVRYWDYRYRKIQFQGHICLVSTIVWGFLSLFMVYVIHPPVKRLVEGWNVEFVNIATFIITLCITYDFTNAFREAMDLRKLIMQAEELREKLAKALEERAEIAREELERRVAEGREFHEENQMRKREQRMENVAELEYAMEQLHLKVEEHSRRLLRRNPRATMKGFEEDIKRMREKIYRGNRHK